MKEYVLVNIIWALSLALALFLAGLYVGKFGAVAIMLVGLVILMAWILIYYRALLRRSNGHM